MKTVTLVLIITTFSVWDSSVKKVETKRVESVSMEQCKDVADSYNKDYRYRDNIKAICVEEDAK